MLQRFQPKTSALRAAISCKWLTCAMVWLASAGASWADTMESGAAGLESHQQSAAINALFPWLTNEGALVLIAVAFVVFALLGLASMGERASAGGPPSFLGGLLRGPRLERSFLPVRISEKGANRTGYLVSLSMRRATIVYDRLVPRKEKLGLVLSSLPDFPADHVVIDAEVIRSEAKDPHSYFLVLRFRPMTAASEDTLKAYLTAIGRGESVWSHA